MKTIKRLWEENNCQPIKVRKDSWKPGTHYVVFGFLPDDRTVGYFLYSTGSIDMSCLTSSAEVELYVPPKPKTKMYKFAFLGSAGWQESGYFYKDEEDFLTQKMHIKGRPIRIDNSVIEVEDVSS